MKKEVENLKNFWNFFSDYQHVKCRNGIIKISIEFILNADIKRASRKFKECGFIPKIKEKNVFFEQEFDKNLLKEAGIENTKKPGLRELCILDNDYD